MASFKRLPEVQSVVERIRRNLRRWGIGVSRLARQLRVTRQYAWQIVHYRTQLSLDRAIEIEREVNAMIAARGHLKTFGDRLRAARLSAGLTLKEVAGMIGYTWVGVERWEKNICRPKPGVLWHLCSVYEIPIGAVESPSGSGGSSSGRVPHPGIRTELAETLMSEDGILGSPRPVSRERRAPRDTVQGTIRIASKKRNRPA
jgi:transcriptional regulator with XRE-family HTH domain